MSTVKRYCNNKNLKKACFFVDNTKFSLQKKNAVKRLLKKFLISYSDKDIMLDFEDIQMVLQDKDFVIVEQETSTGNNAAFEAVKNLTENIVLEDIGSIALFFIVSSSFKVSEIEKAMNIIYENVGNDTDILFALSVNDSQEKDCVSVGGLFTGVNNRYDGMINVLE